MSTLDWIIVTAIWCIPAALLFMKARQDGKRHNGKPDQDPWGMM
jgi:hypothetical protein